MPAGSGRWTDADMACGSAQVGDARDLVQVRQATVGTADDSGFSAARAPPRVTKLADFRVALLAEDPSRPVDSDVTAAVDEVLTVLRAVGAKVAVQPTSLPADLATNHQPASLPLVYGAFSYDSTGPTPASHTALQARLASGGTPSPMSPTVRRRPSRCAEAGADCPSVCRSWARAGAISPPSSPPRRWAGKPTASCR
ncbi:hypothetical protein OG562_41900 [Streptomyces sp. NBC_01275]|uniref:hypothetical protein n=1 Tax=Streptomyces sp. NBC_01275 TaxID=2903807 RepID=UPI002252D843|nr:hypothetical protein [Streptomyces sp. NBC_01275]MCX4767401.1 hypothetical protein [Streptomyces sp. NBC_01275]